MPFAGDFSRREIMTLEQIITMVDDIKPNSFSNETKTSWINEVEGLVQTEVFLLAVEEVVVYKYSENEDTELLVAAPHDKLYWSYLSAMIDFANGEYNKYQNTMQLFNSHFGEYMRWYALHYRPADGECIEQGYYLSAYGIAVKHGFEGTEKEWLETLKGAQGKGFVVSGFYSTLEELEAAVPSPEVGDAYGIGIDGAYDITIYDGISSEWVNVGPLGIKGEPGVGILGVQQIAGDGSPGTSNVYKMDYTDGSFFVFSVYNGADGKDGGAGGWNTLVDKPFESTGDGLIVSDGVLSVDVATDAEEDNTKPITSAAVYNELGNIEILLQTI